MLRLSPSDFAFLWEQCKRCFHLKIVHGIRQPSMPMAGIFKKLEALQMAFFEGRRTTEVVPGMRPGVFRCGERSVESAPIEEEGRPSCYLYGKTDSLIEFDDGSWGILDFKTTTIGPDKAQTYSRQLHAYAHAFENPAATPRILKEAAPRLEPISALGLLCFEPTELARDASGKLSFSGAAQWIEIPRDRKAFRTFVSEAAGVLGGEAPPPSPSCDWCAYAATMREGKLPAPLPAEAAGPKCPRCGASMKQRNGKFGAFWGCPRYPDCKGTLPVSK
jgi:hypothetical protein